MPGAAKSETVVDASPVDTRPGHLPALDGVRGFAVTIVLLYHHGVTWMTGGELTVSMFFTLSGFLITRLLVAEWGRTGTISLRTFYDRRVRRLFPASFLLLLSVAVVWTVWSGNGRYFAPWEWKSGLLYFENFYLQSAGKDYASLFGLGNPVQHLWSLSLEEQVYVVFPVVMIVLLRKRRDTAAVWRAFWVLAAGSAIGFALGAWNRSHHPLWSYLPGVEAKCAGVSCAYYATEVRVGEFLLGAALAVLVSVWSRVPAIVQALKRPLWSRVGLGLLVVAYLEWFTFGAFNEYGSFFFPTMVVINGVFSVIIIGYSLAGTGWANRFLGWAPFRWAGQVTYTIYLVHWPAFMFVDSLKIDPNLPRFRVPFTDWATVDGFWMFAFKLAITLAIVCVVYYLVENPIRQRRYLRGGWLYLALAVTAVAGLLVVSVGADRRAAAGESVLTSLNAEAIRMQQDALDALPELPDDAPTVSAIDPELPARLLMVGDSQSWVLASGLETWEADHGVNLVPAPGVGCGVGENTRINYLGVDQPERPGCSAWREALPDIVGKFDPNVVIIVGGTADLSDRMLPGSDTWAHVGEAGYDRWMLDQFAAFTDVVASTGARVLWFTIPDVNPPYVPGETGQPPFAESDTARTDRYNELIREYAASDDRVTVVEFASAVKAHEGGEFEPRMRPDGAHIDLKYAPELIDLIDASIRGVMRSVGP